MRHPEYSSIDPRTGNLMYRGPLEMMPGNHGNMPSNKTPAYKLLPGDEICAYKGCVPLERGHICASSLGGINAPTNISAMHSDVNHGGQMSVERGERAALQKGVSIYSEKTAIVNGNVGDRPAAFTTSDVLTYPGGHVENIHTSLQNEGYAFQAEMNEISASLPDTFTAANPGDSLRTTMTAEEYAEMMSETDQVLPNLSDEYAPADFSGVPACVTETSADLDASAMVADMDAQCEAEAELG